MTAPTWLDAAGRRRSPATMPGFHRGRIERLARGLSTGHVEGRAGAGLIPPEIERKTVEELEAYLLGRHDARGDHEPESRVR